MSLGAVLRAVPRIFARHEERHANPPPRPQKRWLTWFMTVEERRVLREWRLWQRARSLGMQIVSWEYDTHEEAGGTGRSVRRYQIILDDLEDAGTSAE